MHYIRLLRPATLENVSAGSSGNGGGRVGHGAEPSSLALLFTITTDLGDYFLCPDEPVRLSFTLDSTSSSASGDEGHFRKPLRVVVPDDKGKKGQDHSQGQAVCWKSGMRAVNVKVRLDEADLELVRGGWGGVGTGEEAATAAVVTVSACAAAEQQHPQKQKQKQRGKQQQQQQQQREQQISLTATRDLLPRKFGLEERGIFDGLIAPASVELLPGDGGVLMPADVCLRRCRYGGGSGSSSSQRPALLEIEEDIGESIARHIWDAGLVTAAAFLEEDHRHHRHHRCDGDDDDMLTPLIPDKDDDDDDDALNILEIGCGVGVLGIGIAASLDLREKRRREEGSGKAGTQKKKKKRGTVLLTDLPEAEERARANVGRFLRGRRRTSREKSSREEGEEGEEEETEEEGEEEGGSSEVVLDYENLDWDDGMKGTFGALVGSRVWDYVVLSDCTYNVDAFPSLVGTLSALHEHNEKLSKDHGRGSAVSKVLLSTKRRHDSEEALFDLLKAEGWSYELARNIALPRLGDEDETVEIYGLRKGGQQEQLSLKGKRKAEGCSQDDHHLPSKR